MAIDFTYMVIQVYQYIGIDIEIEESVLADDLCERSMEIDISPGHMVSKIYIMTISKDNADDEYSDLKCNVCIIDSKNKKIRTDLDLIVLPDSSKEIKRNSNGIIHMDSNACPELSNYNINKNTISLGFTIMAIANDEVSEYTINCTLKYNSKMHGSYTKISIC